MINLQVIAMLKKHSWCWGLLFVSWRECCLRMKKTPRIIRRIFKTANSQLRTGIKFGWGVSNSSIQSTYRTKRLPSRMVGSMRKQGTQLAWWEEKRRKGSSGERINSVQLEDKSSDIV